MLARGDLSGLAGDGEVTVMSPRGAGARTALRGADAFSQKFDCQGPEISDSPIGSSPVCRNPLPTAV